MEAPLNMLMILSVIVGSLTSIATSQESVAVRKSWIDSLPTIEEYVLGHINEFAPQELRVQKRIRGRFQRQGYAAILHDLVGNDLSAALFSYIRVKLQIEYSMEHKMFWIVAPDSRAGNPGVPYPDDWSFPPDPWKHEWWMENSR